MSCSTGPSIVTNGLILNLDSFNRKSNVLGAPNSLINVNSWALGNTAVTGYALNQTVANENSRIIDTDPWGNQSIVWGSFPSADSNNDGGWEGSYVATDNSKTYRFSVWVRRTSATSSGNFYLGLHTNGTGDTFSLSSGASATNPYWDVRNIGNLTQNTWYLVVGHIFPAGYTGTTAHVNSGLYTVAGGTTKVATLAGNVPNDVKFPNNATSFYHRTYHFYSTDSTSRLQFSSPRIDLIDETEPSIGELLTNGYSSFRDLSLNANHHSISYNPTYTNNRFTLDGSTQGFTKGSALSGVTSTCTVVMWYATTDTSELWVKGQTNSHYLSASASNNYYHGLCGTPTNYVDLNTVVRPDTPVNYRNGNYHMWEAKNVDFSAWTQFDWWLYPAPWQMAGSSSVILVYNRVLSENESLQNYAALRGRFGI